MKTNKFQSEVSYSVSIFVSNILVSAFNNCQERCERHVAFNIPELADKFLYERYYANDKRAYVLRKIRSEIKRLSPEILGNHISVTFNK